MKKRSNQISRPGIESETHEEPNTHRTSTLKIETHKEQNQKLLAKNIDSHIEIIRKPTKKKTKNFWARKKILIEKSITKPTNNRSENRRRPWKI